MSATDDSAPSGRRSDAVRMEWSADPRFLADIRRAVDIWLTRLEITPDLRDDLVYATSEAVSNSVEHAYRAAVGFRNLPDDPPPHGAPLDGSGPGGAPSGVTVTVTMWASAGTVNIEIADHGCWLPPASGPSNRGHGLRLIRGLVESVSVESRAAGTIVSLRQSMPSGTEFRAEPARGG